jgi:hypothetical protein
MGDEGGERERERGRDKPMQTKSLIQDMNFEKKS